MLLVLLALIAGSVWLLGPAVASLPQAWQAMSANQVNAGWRVGAGLLGLVCPGGCLLLVIWLLRARPAPPRRIDDEPGPDAP